MVRYKVDTRRWISAVYCGRVLLLLAPVLVRLTTLLLGFNIWCHLSDTVLCYVKLALNDGNVTCAGWQVTLCDFIWHASSYSSEGCCKLL